MFKVVARMEEWWKARRRPAGAPVPYEITCTCGQQASGYRQPRHQVVRCRACNREFFVLPQSPLPPVTGVLTNGQPAAPPVSSQPHLRIWLWPLAAAAGTAVVVILTLALVFFYPFLGRTSRPATAVTAPADLAGRIDAGRKALAEGKYQQAVKELEAARALRERHPQALSAAAGRQLNQLHRQAALLADLLTESLEEILRHAAGLEKGEWQEVFARRYQGKAFVFDAEVRRDAAGRYAMDYRLRAGDEPVRLELGELKLLRALPLDEPRRLLFGARLASARREERGAWVVRLDPDSGVLLTDPSEATACCANPPDADLREVLERQAAWIADLP